MYWWVNKNVVTEGSQEPNTVSPRSNGSVFANSVFSVTLQTINTMNNDSQLCMYYLYSYKNN